MLPNQVAAMIRPFLPVATLMALLTAHGFSPSEAEVMIDSLITLAVTIGTILWAWWAHRPKAIVAQAAALPLGTMPLKDVAVLIDQITRVEQIKEIRTAPILGDVLLQENPKVVSVKLK